MKKIKIYSPITQESGVKMIFAKLHTELGFPKLVTDTSIGFDIDSIEYKGEDVTVEFEYVSSNFIRHGHPDKMAKGRKYVIVCWYDDCNITKKLKDLYGKELKDVICLNQYVETTTKTESMKARQDIKYIILNYNPDNADNRSFQEWSNANLYRINTKFKEDSIPSGSKVLIKQGDFIVGGFDVVRYEYIENLTDEELILYKKLTDYPITLFDNDMDELKTRFTKGHIFYDNFFTIDKVKIKFSEQFPNRKMSHDGRIYITKEEYDSLIRNEIS